MPRTCLICGIPEDEIRPGVICRGPAFSSTTHHLTERGAAAQGAQVPPAQKELLGTCGHIAARPGHLDNNKAHVRNSACWNWQPLAIQPPILAEVAQVPAAQPDAEIGTCDWYAHPAEGSKAHAKTPDCYNWRPICATPDTPPRIFKEWWSAAFFDKDTPIEQIAEAAFAYGEGVSESMNTVSWEMVVASVNSVWEVLIIRRNGRKREIRGCATADHLELICKMGAELFRECLEWPDDRKRELGDHENLLALAESHPAGERTCEEALQYAKTQSRFHHAQPFDDGFRAGWELAKEGR